MKAGLLKYLFVLMAVGFLCSCGKKSLSAVEYVKWVSNEDNGLCAKTTIEDYEFSLLYKPLDYVALQENHGKAVSADSLEKIKKTLSGMQYYTFKIKARQSNELMANGIKEDNEYYQRLEYFMGPMQNDIELIDGKDTLACTLFHFERNYGLAPFNNFVLAFEQTDKTQQNNSRDKTLLFSDQVLGTGPVRLTIKGQQIDHTPILQLN